MWLWDISLNLEDSINMVENMLVMQFGDIIYFKTKYVWWNFNDLITVDYIFSIISFPWLRDNKIKIMLVIKIPCCTKQNFFTFQKYTKRYYIFSDQMKKCLNKFLRYEWEIVFVRDKKGWTQRVGLANRLPQK